jgi:biotin carboxyl carrier protein
VRYFVTLDPWSRATPAVVDVVDRPGEGTQVRIDGREVDVDVERVGGAMNVRVNGHVFDLTIEGAWPAVSVSTGGHRASARVESERGRAAEATIRARPGAAGRDPVVRSPMPGRVVRVLVAAGDVVAVGQGVAVLEAMKMENEVRSTTGGTVAVVHVASGATVEANAALITFAREPAP